MNTERTKGRKSRILSIDTNIILTFYGCNSAGIYNGILIDMRDYQ